LHLFKLAAATCLSAALGSATLADQSYTYEFIGASGTGKTTLIKVLVSDLDKPSRISLNHGQDGAVYGHLNDRKLFVVDEKNKSVMDVGEMMAAYRSSGLAGTGSQPVPELDAAQDLLREKLEEMLAQMPKSQRPAMRKILEQQLGVKSKPTKKPTTNAGLEVTETGEVRFENAVEQHLIVISVGGEPVSEVWVTDPANIDGGQIMVDAMAELSDLFDELVGDAMIAGKNKDAGMDTFEFARQLARLNKFPIMTTDLEDDETILLENASRDRELDPDAFEPPAGYKRRSM